MAPLFDYKFRTTNQSSPAISVTDVPPRARDTNRETASADVWSHAERRCGNRRPPFNDEIRIAVMTDGAYAVPAFENIGALFLNSFLSNGS